MRGGINLQDIQTKIDTYRIHLIHTINSPEYKNPLPKYYCAWQLRNHVQANNNTPRCTVNIKKLPKFYQNLINTVKNHELVALAHTTTKLTYQTLIQQKAVPLGDREIIHARHYDGFEFSEPFTNLHKKLITPLTIYLLLFTLLHRYEIHCFDIFVFTIPFDALAKVGDPSSHTKALIQHPHKGCTGVERARNFNRWTRKGHFC